MTSQHDNAKRWRFTMSELLVYVSLLCLSLGILRTAYTVDAAYPYSASVILLGFIVLGAYCVLGALVGIALAFLVSGRHGLFAGGTFGAIALLVLLTIAFLIMSAGQPRHSVAGSLTRLDNQIHVTDCRGYNLV